MKKTGAVELGETYNDGLLIKNQIGCQEDCCVEKRESRKTLCPFNREGCECYTGSKPTKIEKLEYSKKNEVMYSREDGLIIISKINQIIVKLNSL